MIHGNRFSRRNLITFYCKLFLIEKNGISLLIFVNNFIGQTSYFIFMYKTLSIKSVLYIFFKADRGQWRRRMNWTVRLEWG